MHLEILLLIFIIMATDIGRKIFLMYLFLGILSGFAQIQIQDAKVEEINQYALEAYAKIKSIKKMSQDVLQIYREMGATPKQIAIPYVFLSFLGYPNYFTVAPDQNVCIFMYFSSLEGKRKYIILAKLLEGANVARIIQNLGGSIEEYEGWTFFAKQKEDFKIIKDKKWMITYANGQSKNDIEFSIQPSIISLTKLGADRGLTEALKNLNETTGSININSTQILMDGVLNYKNQEPEFANWIKNSAQAGLTTKIMPKGKNEAEMHIVLERNNLSHLIHELRAKVSLFEQRSECNLYFTPINVNVKLKNKLNE